MKAWFTGIKGRLVVLQLVPLVFLMIISLVGYFSLNKTIERVDLFAKARVPITSEVISMESYSHGIPRYVWLAMAYNDNLTERKKFIERSLDLIEKLSVKQSDYSLLPITDEAKQKIKEIAEPIKNLHAVVLEAKDLLLQNDPQKDKLAKELLITKMPPQAVKITDSLAELTKIATTRNVFLANESHEFSKWIEALVIVMSVLAFVLSGIIGFIVSTKISSELSRITSMISDSSRQLASASHQIADASQSLASSSQEQASSLEQSSASLEQMTGMVENNLKNSESSADLLNSVQGTTKTCNESMKELILSMNEILEANKKIEKLVKVIEEIGEKTEVIDEIVFQTKLLSFNASVEAERAGEHGRGFAVVAQEVGNLAQLSGKSALEISSIVKNSIKEAEEVSVLNKELVTKGSHLVKTTAEYLNDVDKKSSDLKLNYQQILAASKEQNVGIKQISVGVDNLNKTTQSTAAAAEEAAASSQELNSQAEMLDDLVHQMKQFVHGNENHSDNKNNVIEFSKSSAKSKNKNIKPHTSKAKSHFNDDETSSENEVHSSDKVSGSDSLSAWEKL